MSYYSKFTGSYWSKLLQEIASGGKEFDGVKVEVFDRDRDSGAVTGVDRIDSISDNFCPVVKAVGGVAYSEAEKQVERQDSW